jgi:hypothetical protein
MELNNISLEEKNENTNFIGVGIFILFFSAIFARIIEIPGAYFFIVFLSLFIRILVSYAVYKIAKSLNRNVFGWVVFGLIVPAIALIWISSLNYFIDDPNAKKIVKACRKEYKAAIRKLAKNKKENYAQEKQDIFNKYDAMLKSKITNLKVDKLINDYQIEDSEIELQKELLAQGMKSNNESGCDNEEIEKCPACGAFVSSKSIICPDCELRLK